MKDEDDFVKNVGAFIHHCGALELLTNNAIMTLGQDAFLSSEMTRAPFGNRIRLLRALLGDRTGLSPPDVKYLCDELQEIAKSRNMVAHNPIWASQENLEDLHIAVLRYAPMGAAIKDRITSEDLLVLVKKSSAALQKFTELVPGCLKAE